MLIGLGYKAESAYVAGLTELFGKYAASGDHLLEFKEFKELWGHLHHTDAEGDDGLAGLPGLTSQLTYHLISQLALN
jgi:hypothetical protein